MDVEGLRPPFEGLREWLLSRHIFLTDKQSCFRLFIFIAQHAARAGVPEGDLAQALNVVYHPRRRRAQPSDSVART